MKKMILIVLIVSLSLFIGGCSGKAKHRGLMKSPCAFIIDDIKKGEQRNV